jgi:hypothetical protein
MRLFVTSDIHSYWTPFKKALDDAGFEPDNKNHLLIVLGDVFDRGGESWEVYNFLNNLTNVILVRGNHEDLLEELLNRGYGEKHDHSNGTTRTVVDLVDYTGKRTSSSKDCCDAVKWMITPFLNKFVNYFETKNYIFVHGWIPCDGYNINYPWHQHGYKLKYKPDWRNAAEEEFAAARWVNGIKAGFVQKDKVLEHNRTICCGHWHCSYGHYQKAVKDAIVAGIDDVKVSEFGDDACFEPFYADGMIALDACTAHSRKVNVIVLEDDLLEEG